MPGPREPQGAKGRKARRDCKASRAVVSDTLTYRSAFVEMHRLDRS